MSAIVGKHFRPTIGASYKRAPRDGADTHAGAFTTEAAAKVASFEIVGIENGHALVRLPSGSLRYLALDAGEVVDPPPAPRVMSSIHREFLTAMSGHDPVNATDQAHALGYTGWTAPAPIDYAGVPALRQLAFKVLERSDPAGARQQFAAWRASPEGQAEIVAEVSKQAAAAQPQQPAAAPEWLSLLTGQGR